MKTSVMLATSAGCCLALLACSTQMQTPAPGLVIADVTVISPERDEPLEHAYVRIQDKRIVEVSAKPLRGEQEIDGRGRFLIPGLIDSHVHLAVSPGFPAAMTAVQAAAHPEIVADTLAQDPRSYLFFGFTTLLDLVGSAERTAQWNALDVRPDAYFCAAVAIVNGQVRPVHFPYFSYGLPLDQRMPPVSDPAKHTPTAIISQMASDGAICVKTVYDGFVGMTPTADEIKVLVAAAHAHNLPVFIHANRKGSQVVAVAGGVDAIAHGMWRDPNEAAPLDRDAQDLLRTIARRGMGYQPTTRVIAGELDMLQDDYLLRSEVADVYPASFIEWCANVNNDCGAARFKAQTSDARLRGTLTRASEVTRLLAENDARLLFGSDTPSDMLYTNPPGLNARREMDHWIEAGVSEEKLLRALTIDNARMLRLDDEIGTIEAGKKANLLLLRDNPLRNVAAYDTIETVFLHGRPIPRTELSARARHSE